MDLLGLGRPPDSRPVAGADYLRKLHKYLTANIGRLAPQRPTPPSFFQQGYTLLTLGLDPNSQPLSRNVKVPLTLGFGTPTEGKPTAAKPVLLRLPPDRLLYLLLRWQSLPQHLPHVGRTDVPISPGVPVAARGARVDERDKKGDGDVDSVKSWVGSVRSVSLGSMSSQATIPGLGWMSKKQEVTEDQLLLALYSAFTVLPALLIHPPFLSDKPIAELVDAGGYTQLGGIDVRVPLDVLRNLQILELEGYDPRGLLLPVHPGLRSLTVRDVQDADDWIEELLSVEDTENQEDQAQKSPPSARFPNLRHLSLYSTTMISFPVLPLARLTHLDLSHNLLNSIPSSLSHLSSLQSLNLSNNLIQSVRNAPQVLGNITTLNLSKNRIDCLVGLERVLGLERVDMRSNELMEVGEVGRLAVLPHLKGVWCANNLFDHDGEDWRSELGTAFAVEGRHEAVVVDDRPWTWQEKRKIESALTTRGRTRRSNTHPVSQPHSRQASSSTTSQSPAPPPARGPAPGPQLTQTPRQQAAPPTPSTSHHLPTPNSDAAPSRRTVSPAPAPAPAAVHKKRRPRRVITLDEDTPTSKTAEDELPRIGGSLRLPPKNGEAPSPRSFGSGAGTEIRQSKGGPKRSALGADTFKPPPSKSGE